MALPIPNSAATACGIGVAAKPDNAIQVKIETSLSSVHIALPIATAISELLGLESLSVLLSTGLLNVDVAPPHPLLESVSSRVAGNGNGGGLASEEGEAGDGAKDGRGRDHHVGGWAWNKVSNGLSRRGLA